MEIWKTIPSFTGKYEASSLGRIRRVGKCRGSWHGRILRSRLINSGYLIIGLHSNNQAFPRLVHRLVCEAFHGFCKNGFEVNHKDGNKTNNRPDNLEYLTRSQNLLHAVETQGCYRGERNSQAIINESIVREIRKKHAEGMGYKRLAKHFGLSWGLVRCVATRKTWRHLD